MNEQEYFEFSLSRFKDLNRFDWQTRRDLKDSDGDYRELIVDNVVFKLREEKINEPKNSQTEA